MEGIPKFIQRCYDLESLELTETQHIDCRMLDWQSPENKLRAICMTRVKMTTKKFFQLLFPPPDSEKAPPIYKLELRLVELLDGTGNAISQRLLCTSLRRLIVRDLEYTSDGGSARPWEPTPEWEVIWTKT